MMSLMCVYKKILFGIPWQRRKKGSKPFPGSVY